MVTTNLTAKEQYRLRLIDLHTYAKLQWQERVESWTKN